MDMLKQDYDSDVEILEPEVLKEHYRVQQLRLITALSKYPYPIPKKWEDFQIFVKNVLKFYLSSDLVRSIWVELCAADQLTNCINTSSVVEISDDEEDKKTVKQHNEHFSNIGGVIDNDLKGGKPSKEQWPDYVEISDEEESSNQSHLKPNIISDKSDDDSKQILERSFSVPNRRKRNRNGIRRSLPNPVDEEEAEALREKLLLDKIIELELPQVIKSFMNKNNLENKLGKKRKKNCGNSRESTSGTSSDNLICASEML